MTINGVLSKKFGIECGVPQGSCAAEVLDAMEKCIADVHSWMINDKLMLNDDETEFLVIGTSKQLPKVSVSSIRVGDVDM